jgi:hypothetical protein
MRLLIGFTQPEKTPNAPNKKYNTRSQLNIIEMQHFTRPIGRLALVSIVLTLGAMRSAAMPQIASINETICDLTLWSPRADENLPLKKEGVFTFNCSLKDRDRGDGSVILTNLSTNETYVGGQDGGWATGRRCLYKEGFAEICTRAEWQLIEK